MSTTIHLRQRKQTSKGKISLYLEYYKGTAKSQSGTIIPVREYEYLDLYLIDKPKTLIDRERNKEILDLAKSIKAKKELEIKNGEWGFKSGFKQSVKVMEYFKSIADQRKETAGTYMVWMGTAKHLDTYGKLISGRELTFADIDVKFCEGFKTHLITSARTLQKQEKLSSGTAGNYFIRFKACLKQAVKDGIIPNNPAAEITLPKTTEHKRAYLTLDELRVLAKTPCQSEVLKRAFLFSCLSGLRWSDIQKMVWSEVQTQGDGWRIVFKQQKTKELQYHDISQQARTFMGEQGMPDEKVFSGLYYSTTMLTALASWINSAGITKKITFHCGRHTYAVLQLDNGTDILTLSKMLGHAAITTTMVYSQIMDKKRITAANCIPSISL
ncbi:MAG: site-specific integrase [Chlorobiaceae bacterium]